MVLSYSNALISLHIASVAAQIFCCHKQTKRDISRHWQQIAHIQTKSNGLIGIRLNVTAKELSSLAHFVP